MNYLSAENIARNLGERWLFRNVSVGVSQGDKVAIVGKNGSGKTSMLDVLAGIHLPDDGLVSVRKGVRVGYLPQNPVFDETLTVVDTLFSGESPVLKAIKAYEKALLKSDDSLTQAMEQMEQLKAWDYEAKVKQILGKLGISDFDKKVSQLSGGQRKRVAMARILIDSPDLLIFDEPTNHLDLETIEWLEGYLSTQNTTLILVTHDRYFLDKVCNEIWELTDGRIYRHKGNYAYFLEKKADRETVFSVEIDKAKNLLRKELDWMRRQPQARGTKAQYRIDAFYELKDKANQKLDNSQIQLNVQTARQGSKIMEIEYLTKAFNGKKVVDNFTYTFQKRDRVGVVGKNGMGKTTLLNLITKQIRPDSGKVTLGETTKPGYYTQEEFPFKDGQRVIDIINEVAEVIRLGTGETITASQFLTHFLFPPAMQYNDVSKLSGGEKRRLQLMRVLVQNPNFLILDEPTNDLDLDTLNVLEDFLQSFSGSLVIVSHDRYFMDRLVEHLFVFEDNGFIRDFPGNYTDYREWRSESSSKKPEMGNGKSETNKGKEDNTNLKTEASVAKKKLTFKEQKEFETLEKEIAQLTLRKEQLTTQLNAGTGNYEDLAAWAKEIENITNDLDEKEFRWLELSEFA
ncbi:MAG: ABC-F family ATP-binding cassette domain-containing protein [Spirosomataceae bacterium]